MQNSEECPNCNLSGQRSMLRFFFVNFDEAIYKCSSGTCMYPFENFKFKNVKDNTLYLYEPNDTNQSTSSAIDESSSLWPNDSHQSDNVNSAFLAKTFTPSQSNENIEEFDFDFGFLENIASDEPLPLQTPIASMNETCGQLDDDGIDDFLNDLIHGKCENKLPPDTVATAVQTVNNNQISMKPFNFAEPHVRSPPSVALPSLQSPMSTTIEKKESSAALTAPPPKLQLTASMQRSETTQKLTKCLKTIASKVEKKEKKPRRTKNPVPTTKKTVTTKTEVKIENKALYTVDEPTKLGEVTKVYSRNLVSTKKLPSFELTAPKQMDVDERLLSLMQQQHIHKPLDLLQQLKSLDMSKANAPLVRKIIRKSNAIPTTSVKIEQKQSEPNVADVVSPDQEEASIKPIGASVGAERFGVVQKPSNPFGNKGFIARRMPPSSDMRDLATLYGFDNFGSISYANLEDESFSCSMEFDQIVEEEVEIIPIEVGEDDSTIETVSNAGDLDLFGCSSLSTEFDLPNVGDSKSPTQINGTPAVAITEVSTETDVKPPKTNTKPRQKTETAANDSQTADAIGLPKTKVKRPRKNKIVTIENGTGNIDSSSSVNAVENVIATLPVAKPARKPRKTKAIVSKVASDENLAGFSLNELQESVANAAQKKIKKPRKRNVKPAEKISVDGPSTIADSNANKIVQDPNPVASKTVKQPRKKEATSDKTIIEAPCGIIDSTIAPKRAKKPRQPRNKVSKHLDATIESVASKMIADSIAHPSTQSFATVEPIVILTQVKPIANKSRKKKILEKDPSVNAEHIEGQQFTGAIEPKKQSKRPCKRKIAETTNASQSPVNKKTREIESVAATEDVTQVSTVAAAAIASITDDTKSI